jgi:hypothetical protein
MTIFQHLGCVNCCLTKHSTETAYLNAGKLIVKPALKMLTDFIGGLHEAPYCKLFVIDTVVHVAHGMYLFFFSLQVGLGSPCLEIVRLVLPRRILRRLVLGEVSGKAVPQAAQDVSSPDGADVEADEVVRAAGHVVGHLWWWLAADAALLWMGPQTLRACALGLLYLLFSELFYSGLFFHPYLAMWLGTHGTGSGDFDSGTDMAAVAPDDRSSLQQLALSPDRGGPCQPTMSTYSSLGGLLTGNLTLHVEHHDFPMCPMTRLPRITEIAPEFYRGLRHSRGLLHTLREYLKHGNEWRYACS